MSFTLSWNKLKTFGAAVLASGKKNAPTLMTGGSIVIGWTAVYLFWKQSRNAEKAIANQEFALNASEDADRPLDQIVELSRKEKFVIYLQYCWSSGVMGLISSLLAIGANQLNLSRIAEMALLTQMMSDKDLKQSKVIEKLKEALPNKEVEKIELDTCAEGVNEDAIRAKLKEMIEKGDTRTLFIDVFNDHDMKPLPQETVTNGIEDFNVMVLKRKASKLNEKLYSLRIGSDDDDDSDSPFYSEDDSPSSKSKGPWWLNNVKKLSPVEIDLINSVWASGSLSEFLYYIGFIDSPKSDRRGELLEFRCTSDDVPIHQRDILRYETKYKGIFGPDVVVPTVCYIDYTDLLMPTAELFERDSM